MDDSANRLDRKKLGKSYQAITKKRIDAVPKITILGRGSSALCSILKNCVVYCWICSVKSSLISAKNRFSKIQTAALKRDSSKTYSKSLWKYRWIPENGITQSSKFALKTIKEIFFFFCCRWFVSKFQLGALLKPEESLKITSKSSLKFSPNHKSIARINVQLGKKKNKESMSTCPSADRMNPVLAVTMIMRSWSAVPKMIRLLGLTLLDSFKLRTRCEGESSTTWTRRINSWVRLFSPLPPILSTSVWKSL